MRKRFVEKEKKELKGTKLVGERGEKENEGQSKTERSEETSWKDEERRRSWCWSEFNSGRSRN